MSGHWETVGKRKEKGNRKIVPPTTIKKKVENVNVKVEDVLDKAQVKNLYSNGKNKENKPVEVKKAPESGAKKSQKKQEKPVEVVKPKPPKSVESALKQIDVNEFRSIFDNSKSHFPEAPIVWLKDLAHFLNQRINVELQDPIFTQKPRNFPLITVPPGIKSVIEKALQEAKKSNVQLFFDISLTSMVTDMSKNQPVLGHKIFLQYIALNEPNLVTANLAKHRVLRNSYQNRPNIGLSILWAVGQAGNNNFEAGLTIFQELMLPLIELKSYTRFVIQYLLDVLSSNSEDPLTIDQYLFILEVIFSNNKKFPNDLRQDLVVGMPKLKARLFSGSSKEFKNSLEICLKKLTASVSEASQEHLCDVIVEGFSKDPNSLEHWLKVFTKNITSSAIILRYIDNNWQTVYNKLHKRTFTEVTQQILDVASELGLKKKKDEKLNETVSLTKKLLVRMTEKKNTRSPFKFFFITTCLIIGSLIYYDIKHEGSWQKSQTHRILKNYGVCEYTHLAYDKLQQGLSYIDNRIEENFPDYRKAVIEFSKPYIELAGNLGRVFWNILGNINEVIQEKYPIVMASVESYAPGLVEQSQNMVSSAWSSSVFYFNRSIDYLKTEVFVGQLSPENMQKVVLDAFNTTQHKATEYYHWLYEKVQSAIQ